jgi:hypothetical protein
LRQSTGETFGKPSAKLKRLGLLDGGQLHSTGRILPKGGSISKEFTPFRENYI